MGIQGLLPLLKSIQTPVNLKDLGGKTLAIDGYCWLHKGAFSCAMDLCLGKPTTKYVDFCMERIRMLKVAGIKPYVVLDGGPLPMKMNEETSRKQKREDNLKAGKKFLQERNMKKAMECFQMCVDITGEMALQLIKKLREHSIDYVVAPYEADAQLAYLEKEGIVDGIITEDSDLLVFGCKKVYYKLDKLGSMIEIDAERLGLVTEVDFRGWSLKQFRQMCILSGCDYLENLPGIGLKTAYKLLRKFKSVEKILAYLRMDQKLIVPVDFFDMFQRAELTFVHQRVFDPRTQMLVHLHDIQTDISAKFENLDFLGPDIPQDLSIRLISGEADPNNRKILTIFKNENENDKMHIIKKKFNMRNDENCIISSKTFNESTATTLKQQTLKRSLSETHLPSKKPTQLNENHASNICLFQTKNDETRSHSSVVHLDDYTVVSSSLPNVKHEEYVDVVDEVELNPQDHFLNFDKGSKEKVPDRFHEFLFKLKRQFVPKKAPKFLDVVTIDESDENEEPVTVQKKPTFLRKPLVGLPRLNKKKTII